MRGKFIRWDGLSGLRACPLAVGSDFWDELTWDRPLKLVRSNLECLRREPNTRIPELITKNFVGNITSSTPPGSISMHQWGRGRYSPAKSSNIDDAVAIACHN